MILVIAILQSTAGTAHVRNPVPVAEGASEYEGLERG
jgi:hypothetical protein